MVRRCRQKGWVHYYFLARRKYAVNRRTILCIYYHLGPSIDIETIPPTHTTSREPSPPPSHPPPTSVMENGAITQGEGKDPSSFLSDIIGNPVVVKLNSGVVYKGASRPTTTAKERG